jgi:hypothetical protein
MHKNKLAHIFGIQAWMLGKIHDPAYDEVVCDLMIGLTRGEPQMILRAWSRGWSLAQQYGGHWALAHANGATHQDADNENIFYKQEEHGVLVAEVYEGAFLGWQDAKRTYVPEKTEVM